MFLVVKAFHVKFEEAKLDANIQKWDVEVLQVSSTSFNEILINKSFSTAFKFITQYLSHFIHFRLARLNVILTRLPCFDSGTFWRGNFFNPILLNK